MKILSNKRYRSLIKRIDNIKSLCEQEKKKLYRQHSIQLDELRKKNYDKRTEIIEEYDREIKHLQDTIDSQRKIITENHQTIDFLQSQLSNQSKRIRK